MPLGSIKDIHTKSRKIDLLFCKMSALAQPSLPPCPCGDTINFEKSEAFSKKCERLHLKNSSPPVRSGQTPPSPDCGRLLRTVPYLKFISVQLSIYYLIAQQQLLLNCSAFKHNFWKKFVQRFVTKLHKIVDENQSTILFVYIGHPHL